MNHATAPLLDLDDAMRCRHCGRVDPRCGAKVTVNSAHGVMEIGAPTQLVS